MQGCLNSEQPSLSERAKGEAFITDSGFGHIADVTMANESHLPCTVQSVFIISLWHMASSQAVWRGVMGYDTNTYRSTEYTS